MGKEERLESNLPGETSARGVLLQSQARNWVNLVIELGRKWRSYRDGAKAGWVPTGHGAIWCRRAMEEWIHQHWLEVGTAGIAWDHEALLQLQNTINGKLGQPPQQPILCIIGCIQSVRIEGVCDHHRRDEWCKTKCTTIVMDRLGSDLHYNINHKHIYKNGIMYSAGKQVCRMNPKDGNEWGAQYATISRLLRPQWGLPHVKVYSQLTDVVLRFACNLGRCSRGGCKDIQYLYSYTFSSMCNGKTWGTNPRPNVYVVYVDEGAQARVWLKTL